MSDLNRNQAKKAILEAADEDTEYIFMLDEGEKQRQQIDLALLKEENTHRQITKAQAIGWMGKVFGDKDHAPLWIAIIAIIIGAAVWFLALSFGRSNPDISSAMVEHASKGWTLIFTALGYVFGQQAAQK